MRKTTAFFSLTALTMVLVFGLTGCTVIFQKGRRKDIEKIKTLQTEYSKLQDEMSDLERAKAELEDRLSREIGNKEVSIAMGARGLVITFVAEVLFDSGKSVLRSEALEKLDKVAQTLNTTVRDLNIGIEGHTDNVPIKHSGWKSNWELSAARAMSVLHYLVDNQGLAPERLSGTGFGEYQPVASNDTREGRQKNRRVEIVIFPKAEASKATAPNDRAEVENLK
jgi:chemotaxis protein MotB